MLLGKISKELKSCGDSYPNFYTRRKIMGYISTIAAEGEAYWSNGVIRAKLRRAHAVLGKQSFADKIVNVERVDLKDPGKDPKNDTCKKETDYGSIKGPQVPVDGNLGAELMKMDPELTLGIFRMLYKFRDAEIYVRLFCALAITPKLCHLIINAEILNWLHELPDYKTPIQVALMYAMTVLTYQEDTLMHVTPRHACVLNLEDVCNLPRFDALPEDNPYVPLFKFHEALKKAKVLKYIRPAEAADRRGLYDLAEFRKRFEIFSGGIFTGMNWDKLSVSGSAIPACLMRNPLEARFYSLRNYFDEYYPSKRVLDVSKLSDADVSIVEDELSDIDIIVDEADDDAFDKKVWRIANHVAEVLCKMHGKESLSDREFRADRINTNKSYKYYLSGTLLPRSVEIFRFYSLSPITGVKRFHLPAVRALYDGERVLIMPSAVCCAYSGVCCNYKLIAREYKPQEIILKYYCRGFRTILNSNEDREMLEHVFSNPKYAAVSNTAKSSLRYTSVNNPIFTPRETGESIYHDLEKYGYDTKVRYLYVEDGYEPGPLVTPVKVEKGTLLRNEHGELNPPLWSNFEILFG